MHCLSAFAFCGLHLFPLLVALPDSVHLLLGEFLGEEADEEDNGEAADHGDGTAVDGVGDGIVGEHVHDDEADTPDVAGPHGGRGDTLPVEAEEEGGEEGSCQGSPTDAHELGDEGGGIEGDEQGNGDEEDDEDTHHHHLAALDVAFHTVVNLARLHFVRRSLLVTVDEVEGHGRTGRKHQTCQRGHGGGKDEQHHESDDGIVEGDEHGGDDAVESNLAVGIVDGRAVEQATETAEEVTSAADEQGEDGADDRATLDGCLVGDGVELTHHLGQPPGAKRGEDDHAEQVPRVGAKEVGKHAAAHFGTSVGWQHRQFLHGSGETTLTVQHGGDDQHDAENHDAALDEVVDSRGLIAAKNDIDGGEDSHRDGAVDVGDAEAHLEQRGDALIDTGGVGDEEHEGDDGGHDAEALAAVADAEEVGHGARTDVLCHHLGAATENPPCQQRADDGVADANPSGRHAILPAELSCIADEDHGGEVAGAVGESREPAAHVATAEHKAIDGIGLFA